MILIIMSSVTSCPFLDVQSSRIPFAACPIFHKDDCVVVSICYNVVHLSEPDHNRHVERKLWFSVSNKAMHGQYQLG
jgi:hypothetical protein